MRLPASRPLRTALLCLPLLALAAWFLFDANGFRQNIVYLLLLACPLLHVFMHRHHGRYAPHDEARPGSTEHRHHAEH